MKCYQIDFYKFCQSEVTLLNNGHVTLLCLLWQDNVSSFVQQTDLPLLTVLCCVCLHIDCAVGQSVELTSFIKWQPVKGSELCWIKSEETEYCY